MVPTSRPSREGEKADVIELFQQLIASGISIGAFSAMYQVAKLWLEHRKTCDIMLKFSDGSEMSMQGLSWEEAEQKMREHQKAQAPKDG